jgi:hypothetical protein
LNFIKNSQIQENTLHGHLFFLQTSFYQKEKDLQE